MQRSISDHRIDSAEIPGLVATLDSHTTQFGPDDPQTLTVACRLAVAFWSAGYIDRAIGLLDQAVDLLTASLGREHPMRVDALSTLGEMVFQEGHAEQAGVIHREVLECRLQHAGANDPDTLAAKGDLATVLFALDQEDEAEQLEREAFESAQVHLGKTHSVTCVLAWNRVLSYERRGQLDSARKIVAGELAWLLPEDPASLESNQTAIRGMLAKRLNWDSATAC
jgi:hypothetical protein